MLNYKSMSNDELREILASAGTELLSRRSLTVDNLLKPHMYRITMRRTSAREPQAFRCTLVEGAVVRIPLPLDQIIGKTGKVIGGEFFLDDGDVVQKIFSSGMERYHIAWRGSLDHPDYDADQVLQGETEAETIEKIEQFVRGDRKLLIEDLTNTITSWSEQIAEYEEKGKRTNTGSEWLNVIATEYALRKRCFAGRNRRLRRIVHRIWNLNRSRPGDCHT
jgi:hypothetical protein